jgi:ribose 5-phosphate isomerase RpiB
MNNPIMRKNQNDLLVRKITELVLQKLNTKGVLKNTGSLRPVTTQEGSENKQQGSLDREAEGYYIDGIVTVRKLEGYRSIKISKKSIITPAAKDFIKEKKILVRVEDVDTKPNRNQENINAGWAFWSACSLLKDLCGDICEDNGIHNCSVNHGEDNTLAAIEKLNQAILNGKKKGGILVVRTSANAAFLASRFPNMRTVVGSFPKTIEDGIQQFGANVLILEHAYLGRVAMTEMIKQFTNRRPSNLDITTALEGC